MTTNDVPEWADKIADSEFFVAIYTKNFVKDRVAREQLKYAIDIGRRILVLKEIGTDLDMALFEGAVLEGIWEFERKNGKSEVACIEEMARYIKGGG